MIAYLATAPGVVGDCPVSSGFGITGAAYGYISASLLLSATVLVFSSDLVSYFMFNSASPISQAAHLFSLSPISL